MPNPKTSLFIGFLVAVSMLLGFNYFFKPFASIGQQAAQTEATPQPSPTLPPEQILFESLSDQEKVAQVLAAPVVLPLDSASPSAEISWIEQYQPGVVTIFGERIATDEATLAIRQLKQSAQKIRLLVAVDHEGGAVQRLSGDGFSFIPSWKQTCTTSVDKKQQLFADSARELATVGVNVVLAPMLDYGFQNQVLGSRICSSDPAVVTENVLLFGQSFYNRGILPVFKHFPGIGQTSKDLHNSFDRITVATDSAKQYRQVLDIFPEAGVMTAHVGVENQYPDIPCSLSGACVGQIKTNYPQALVFTDALEMDAAGFVATGAAKPLSKRAIDAVAAGNEVLIFGPTVNASQLQSVYQALLGEYQTNTTFKTVLDQAVYKIIQRKYQDG